jgi:AcrR family transcriptional regulator
LKTRPRGRPRSTAARAAILAAAREILDDGGITAVTVEAIAARAGVGKPTVYRSWPNAHAVAMAALMNEQSATPAPAHSRSAVADLKRQLREVASVFASRAGRQAAVMIAAASAETELSKSFRHYFIMARREEGKAIVKRAIDRLEIRASTSIDVLLDMIYGSIFFRLLLGHGPLEKDFTDAVVDQALSGCEPDR